VQVSLLESPQKGQQMKTLNSKLIFFGLQILDFLTTLACIHYGLPEASPFTARMIAALGIAGLILTKVLACIAILPIKKLVWVGNITYIVVVVWNAVLISLAGFAIFARTL
jgi:hypothetical protein